ncbi:hypothetical protein AO376_1130 [Moraxella catarrhalis]|nr:hypothetical protein AO376_1130 [Moraxella catarrhalis]OAV16329.1 hypothetical protein AO374_1816 [Moraxella catarrhalis]
MINWANFLRFWQKLQNFFIFLSKSLAIAGNFDIIIAHNDRQNHHV